MEKHLEGEDKEEDREETVDEKIVRLGKEVEDLGVQVRRMLSTLPPIARPPVPEPLLQLRRAIKGAYTQRELLIEDQRASKVVDEYLGENPSILENVDECPICLDPIFDVKRAGVFLCCGNVTCGGCAIPLLSGAAMKNTCPLCREPFPLEGESLRILRTKAAEGKAWAQCRLAIEHDQGSLGLAVDEQKAESLFRSAAGQGYSGAQHRLGDIDRIRRKYSEAFRLLEGAASQGHMGAVGGLGQLYYLGDGVEKDRMKAAQLLTVSAKLQSTDRSVHSFLGDLFYNGDGGLERSMVRSAYYLKPALEICEQPPVFMRVYGLSLHGISSVYYPDYKMAPPGDNQIPEALFWFRRANAKSMNAEALKFVESLESKLKEDCACCFKRLSADTLKCCTECKAAYYCSRECQASDWKAGHKKDCVKSLKKRLRATGRFRDI